MLSGISEKGTDHKDHMSFASELKLGTNSPTIELPNDADPTQEPVKYAPPQLPPPPPPPPPQRPTPQSLPLTLPPRNDSRRRLPPTAPTTDYPLPPTTD